MPPPIDHFDRLPDPIILLVLNNVADVKSLGRISAVCNRFRHLVPQVDSVLIRVDCVISDDSSNPQTTPADKSRSVANPFSSLIRHVIGSIAKPFYALIGRWDYPEIGPVTHHSPTQVLKNFNQIRVLKIKLPSGELGVDEGVLLKWRADFGSTLDNCVILCASSVVKPNSQIPVGEETSTLYNQNPVLPPAPVNDNGSIPESFYTNGGLKLRVVWTISALIAASARHYLLQPIISEHETLNSLVLTDTDNQGMLCMNKEQLEELRVKPLSASAASKRTLVPALNMRLWYAPNLELPDGTVMEGATLVAIRPSEVAERKEVREGSWVGDAFEEPFGTAAKMLIKRRTYCLEMNSF